jgi:hypothetical protein
MQVGSLAVLAVRRSTSRSARSWSSGRLPGLGRWPTDGVTPRGLCTVTDNPQASNEPVDESCDVRALWPAPAAPHARSRTPSRGVDVPSTGQ